MIKTPRLDLEIISEQDADFLVQLMNADNWISNIGDRKVYTVEDSLQYMHDRMDPDLSQKGFVNFVMTKRSSGEKVGTCSLHDRDGVQGLDIGYALLAEHEGNGYASEGAKAMITLAFKEHKIILVNAITTDQNTGSCKVLEKLGFSHNGYLHLPNQTEQLKLYVLSKKAWNTKRNLS